MANELGISKKLRGLNIRQVDKCFEQLSKKQRDDVGILKQKIELCSAEKERLYQLMIDRQMEKERLNKSKELLNLALIRAKESASFFQEKAKEEAEDLLRYARKQNENYEWKIQSIQQDISLTKNHVESLLKEMTKLFQESNLAKYKHSEDNMPNKVVGKILPTGAMKKNFIRSNEQKSDKVPLDSGSESSKKEEKLWIADEKRMTADGSVVAEQNLNVDKERPVPPPAPPSIPEYNKTVDSVSVASSGSSFWDDNSDNREDDLVPEKAISAEINPDANEIAATLEEKKPMPPQYQSLIPPAANAVKTPADYRAPDDSFGRSPAISAEINNIRHKYIVGKIAGESLVANDGSIIVAQNQTITAEIVARAEAEGKLPELIVSMILPGMEA